MTTAAPICIRPEVGLPSSPLRAGTALDAETFVAIRRELMLRHCKWDSQVGDRTTLAAFPLLLRSSHWNQLQTWAERLAVESLAAEHELLTRPDLFHQLGIPRRLRRLLTAQPSERLPRLVRFDFHWTTDGWRISEANNDVPGGLCEASAFPRLLAPHCAGCSSSGDPAGTWADAVAAVARRSDSSDVALVTAPGFIEDHQVMAYLAQRLRDRRIRSHLCSPFNLIWHDGIASLPRSFGAGRLGAVVRFVQAEWLASLPATPHWRGFFNPRTPVLNPVTSTLIESKRFPLVWEKLRAPLPTWRKLLPNTVDPRAVPWRCRDSPWILKTAFCNTGDTVSAADLVPPRQWRAVNWDVRLHPGDWIAQRRFHSVPIDSPAGPIHPCIGVYTIGGRAAGIYGRFSTRGVIDYTATDVAVFIEDHVDEQERP